MGLPSPANLLVLELVLPKNICGSSGNDVSVDHMVPLICDIEYVRLPWVISTSGAGWSSIESGSTSLEIGSNLILCPENPSTTSRSVGRTRLSECA